MKKKKRRLAASLSRILILVAILAPLTPLSLPRAKVTSAQTETTLTAPVLSATAAGSSAIELSWTAVPGAVRYELHTQLVDDPGWRQLDGGNLEGTTFRHGDLTPGKTYQYAVRAIDANDQPLGPWSNFPTETVPSSEAATSTSTPAPRATQSSTTLTAPVLTATAAGSNAIDLSWTSVPGAVRYALFTQLVDDPGWQQIDGGNLRGTSFRHGELAPGKTYQYAVRAIDANDQPLGPWSNFPKETVPASGAPASTPTATSTLTSTPTPGATPTATSTASALSAPSLTATAAGSNAIDLSWTPVRGADRYVLFTQLVAAPGWQQLDGGNLRGTSYRHDELEPGVTYQYAVRAIDANNQPLGPWSNFPTENVPASGVLTSTSTATFTPTSTPVATATATQSASTVTAPALTATAAGSNAIDLSWTSVRGADRYVLFTQLVAAPGWQQLDGGNQRGMSYRHGELTPGKTYQYAVRAIDANNQPLGPWSNFPTETVPASGASTLTPTPTPTPTATASAATPAEQRAALSALYNATGGANWTHNDNWLSNQPLSTWHGVTADGNGHVLRLSLASNGLTGRLPDLSALTNLTTLELDFNELSGPFPDLSALTKLERLELTSNELSGPVPDLSALTNLWWLFLSGNELSGPFPDVSGLANLRWLYAGYNEFSGPFPDLSGLVNLSFVHLAFNEFSGPLPDLSGLTSLRWLLLGHNELSGAFPDPNALLRLEQLDLSHNRLSGPLPDLSVLSALTALSLAGNQLCLPAGATPSHSNPYIAAHLQSLALPLCSGMAAPTPTATATPSGAPASTPTVTPTPTAAAPPVTSAQERAALVALYEATGGANWRYNDNWLSNEPVGAWHGVFTDGGGKVVRLILNRNGLTGQIPDLGGLANLTRLELAYNDLSGQIPALTALAKLTRLDLAGNELSGQIPALSALAKLTRLDLAGNELSGPIPDLSKLTSLTRLDIASNEFSGQVPDLSGLAKLQELIIGDNEFSGQIPDLSALTNLRWLYAGKNDLTGPIPDLSALANLTRLAVDANDLTGPVPDVSPHTILTLLDLSNNRLSGSFPDLSRSTNLEELDLSDNQLTGQITDLSALVNLTRLDLAHNRLTGQIPALRALAGLMDLSLNDNQLTGPFPDLSALTDLWSVNLGNNQLSGPILNLNHIAGLARLDLSNNQLRGPFPDLSHLNSLTSLHLEGNSLCVPQGFSLSGSNTVVAAHLTSLNLPVCTGAETMLTPAVPQNLAAAVGAGRVTLTWDAAANADGYELQAWDSIDRQWGPIGGALTATTYAHTVQTDGRNYYYQVRARDANDVRSAWSDRVYAAVVPTQFPPPPVSLGLDLYFQKYVDVGGVVVVAPSEVSDAHMIQSRAIITGMLANRSDLHAAMAANNTLIFIESDRRGGISNQHPGRWTTLLGSQDPNCDTFIHEFGHLVHYAIEEQANAQTFNTRLRALYQDALNAGRWAGLYASSNYREYWAEMVQFWFQEAMPPPLNASYSKLADYDPEAAKLVEEVFGSGAGVPATCKP